MGTGREWSPPDARPLPRGHWEPPLCLVQSQPSRSRRVSGGPRGWKCGRLLGCWPCTRFMDERGWGSMWHPHHTHGGHGGASAGSSVADLADAPGWACREEAWPAVEALDACDVRPAPPATGASRSPLIGCSAGLYSGWGPSLAPAQTRGTQPRPCGPGLVFRELCLDRALWLLSHRAVGRVREGK